MERIQLTCSCCKKVYDMEKTDELPAHVFFLRCNYCLECDFNGLMQDYYREWWDENENNPNNPPPIAVGENQLSLPF